MIVILLVLYRVLHVGFAQVQDPSRSGKIRVKLAGKPDFETLLMFEVNALLFLYFGRRTYFTETVNSNCVRVVLIFQEPLVLAFSVEIEIFEHLKAIASS